MDILFSLQWVQSFMICSTIQLYSEKAVESVRNARYITCILFQIYFVSSAAYIVWCGFLGSKNYFELRDLTIQNINDIYGYFVYDIVYILIDYPDATYIIHHIVSMLIAEAGKGMGVDETFYHNLICVFLETPSPFLNLRYIIRDYYPKLKGVNNGIIYWSYLLCRIIAFPIIYSFFIKEIKEDYIYSVSTGFALIYVASVMWFLKISKL
jgi:hypothetical protein